MKAGRLLRLWTFAFIATAASCASAAPFLWRIDGASLTRVDLGTGEARSIRLDAPIGIVEPDDTGGAWVRWGSTIARINVDTRVTGSYQFDPASRPAGSLVWDAGSGALWAAAGSQVYRFDEQLNIQSIWQLDRKVSDLAVAGPLAIWVATGDAVTRFDAQGHSLQSTNVTDAAASTRMSRLLVDRQDGRLWMLTGESFFALDAFSSMSQQRQLDAPGNWQSVVLDDRSGDLIVQTIAGLAQINSNGVTNASSTNSNVVKANVGVITFESGSPRSVTMDLAAGALVAASDISEAMHPVTVLSRQCLVAEISSLHGEIASESGIRIILQPRALCDGEECPRAARYLAQLRPSMTLDGTAVDGTYRYLDETGEILFDVAANVAGGVHDAEIFVEDSFGNRSVAVRFSIDPTEIEIRGRSHPKANALPTVALTAPGNSASFAAPANITISATATDTDGTISKVEFYRDGTLLATDTTSPYSYNWNNVAIGSYVLTARAYDNAGGITTSAARTVQVKANVAPAVTLTSPANNANFTAPATVNLAATATDTDGTIAKVEFYNGATKLTTVSGSPYTYAWTNVAGGNYTLTAKATDDKGAITTSAATAISVNRAPTVTLTAPANGTLLAAPANISLAATASDPDGTISKVEFYNGGTKLATDTTSPYSFSWTNVGIGTYALTAQATDNKGATTISNVVNVTVGANKPPAVTLTSPAAGASIKEVATIALAATASDLDGTVAKVEFFNGSTLLGSDTSPPYTYSWKYVYQGTYAITAKATDDKGAATVSAPVTVIVQPNMYPVVTLTAPVDGAEILGDTSSTVQLKATASDPDGSVTKVQFLVDQSLIGAGPGRAVVATLLQPPYVASWTPPTFPVTSIPCFWAEATDDGGFVAASNYACVPFSLDTPPTASLSEPGPIDISGNSATANFLAPATVVFVARATDFDSGYTSDKVAKVEFLDGTTVLATMTLSNGLDGEFVWVWRDVPVGSHSITVRATDTLGKASDTSLSGPALINVFSAIAAPTVILTQPISGQRYLTDATVPLAASVAGGGASIARVDFVAPGAIVGSATAPPFAASWANPPEGTHAITARAFDNFGNVTASRATFITVGRDSRIPLLVMTSPTALNTYPAGVPIVLSADVIDPYQQIGGLDFYAGPTLIGSVTAPPYTVTWANPPAGVVSLNAVAHYDAVQSKASSSITIRVVSGNAPPAVSLTAPASGATFVAPATIALAATATDTDGTIAKVEFFAGSTLVGTSAAAPYAVTWSGVVPGTYALTAKATDDKGAATVSAARTITVNANAAPQVTLTAPTSGQSFAYGVPISVAATAQDSDGTVVKVEFYDGATLLGSASAAPYALIWNGAVVGTHSLTAKAMDERGATTSTAAATITVTANAVPVVTLAMPRAGQSFAAGSTLMLIATASDTDGTVAQVEFVANGAVIGSAPAAPYRVTWANVAAGSYTVVARATDNRGAVVTSASAAIQVVALSLAIASPPPGASIAAEFALLTGTYQAPANSGVTVNGAVARNDGQGHFFVNSFPLADGANPITVTLTTPDGQTLTQTQTLTRTGTAPMQVYIEADSAFAPATFTIRLHNRTANPWTQIAYPNLGGGQLDTSTADKETLGKITYANPGVYQPGFVITDAAGNTYIQTVAILVQDRAAVGTMLKGLWSAMTNTLGAGGMNAALGYLGTAARGRYAPVFSTLADLMPSLIASWGNPQIGSLSGEVAEVVVRRVINGVKRVHFVYLIQDDRGIWRIDSL
jgi:hypothetical protein